MKLTIPLVYLEPVQDLPTWVVALLFLVPFAGGLILYFYKTRHARLWRKGIYPPNLSFNQDNLLEAYLALGSVLILLDYHKAKGKTQFINQYFNRYFKSSNYNFGDSLLFSMNHPTNIDTVCFWLNKHLKEEGERAQVIYFLTGLALLNENFTERELKFLKVMNDKLGLTRETLERAIAIFRSYYASREQTDEERKSKRTLKIDQEKEYRYILNIEVNATKDDIKKAYRKLAKQHHPDLFVNASEAQQNIAEEKFRKIQEAYEFLYNK